MLEFEFEFVAMFTPSLSRSSTSKAIGPSAHLKVPAGKVDSVTRRRSRLSQAACWGAAAAAACLQGITFTGFVRTGDRVI